MLIRATILSLISFAFFTLPPKATCGPTASYTLIPVSRYLSGPRIMERAVLIDRTDTRFYLCEVDFTQWSKPIGHCSAEANCDECSMIISSPSETISLGVMMNKDLGTNDDNEVTAWSVNQITGNVHFCVLGFVGSYCVTLPIPK